MFIITQAHIENMFELEFFQVENEMLKRRQMLLFLRVFFLFFIIFVCCCHEEMNFNWSCIVQ